MSSIKKAWIAAAVAVVFATGLIVWQVKARRSELVNLSAEDMALIADDQPPQFRVDLARREVLRVELRPVAVDLGDVRDGLVELDEAARVEEDLSVLSYALQTITAPS